MMNKLEVSNLFIELDTLFDTRLAVLGIMGEENVMNAISNNYLNRPIDRFIKVDNNRFKDIYENRTKNILKHAVITPISDFIIEYVQKTLEMIHGTPFNYQPKVTINIYPYQLEEDEINTIIKMLIIKTNSLCDVEIVNMSYEDITPHYVKNNVSMMIMYEYYKWLEAHSKNNLFKRTTCPDITLLAPRIYFCDIKETKDDPFDAMEKIAAPFINLKFIDIKNFCFNLNKKTA